MRNCISKMENSGEPPIYVTEPERHEMMLGIHEKDKITNFSKKIGKSALFMATKLSGNMSFPR